MCSDHGCPRMIDLEDGFGRWFEGMVDPYHRSTENNTFFKYTSFSYGNNKILNSNNIF